MPQDKLQGIVERMIAAGESEDDIALVIGHFNQQAAPRQQAGGLTFERVGPVPPRPAAAQASKPGGNWFEANAPKGSETSEQTLAQRIRAKHPGAYDDLTDHELVDVIVDAGESAKSLNRSGMATLLEMVDRREVQTVIVAKLDRLAPSVRDLTDLLERFDRRGVALVSVSESLDTGTATGRLVLNVMISVAQWEREAIGERTSEALRHKKANGQRVGTIPFGYQLASDGRSLEPNAAEQRALAVIRECRAAGFTQREIAAELNRQGQATRRGTTWRHQYVAGLLAAA